jgi:hypothetical protein
MGACRAVLSLMLALSSYAAPPIRPDPKLTPGATLAVTTADVCVPGYTKKIRNVPASVKRRVFALYGITPKPGAYEVDHLISLELGGSNSVRNLWPESYSGAWNARVKDVLENNLHRRVCQGSLPLEEAQKAISKDWIAAYQEYVPSRRKLTVPKALVDR